MSSKYYVLSKTNNPTPEEELEKYYYSGVNNIEYGFFIPGRTTLLSQAFKFRSKKKAREELEQLNRCISFSCESSCFEIEEIVGDKN